MAATPFGPGTVLAGRFTLDDLIGDTDGARFWRATDRTLARNVAVHVIAEDDERSESLLTAARTSALVTDGHLLRVLDAAREDGVVYVVNEWGSGVSLDRLLEEGPLSPRRAAWVVKEVAEAIATAHRNGVAHGRLLPENVMITEAGSVKLIGFVVDAVLRGRTGRDQRRVTGGEPMSAHESDVVNLGGLLYAALVGRWPGAEGSTVPPAPAEHGRPLRPRQVRAGVPRPLDAICERVLNAGNHAHAVPIETAHEVYAALSDYIGDPTGAPQYEATTVLGADDLAQARGDAGPATALHPGPVGGPGGDTDDLPPTGAFPVPDLPGSPSEPGSERDAEATQAGTPVFFDEDTGVGWMSDTGSRGLRGDESQGEQRSGDRERPARRTSAPPPPPPPDLPPRPLFADEPAHRAPTRPAALADEPANETSTGTPTGTHRADRTGAGARRADPAGTSGFARSTGAGNGRVPATWGPDAADDGNDEWETGGWEEERPGSSWLRLAAVVAGVLAAADRDGDVPVVSCAVLLPVPLPRPRLNAKTRPTTSTSTPATTAASRSQLEPGRSSSQLPVSHSSSPSLSASGPQAAGTWPLPAPVLRAMPPVLPGSARRAPAPGPVRSA
ncbi:MAG TPA: protein kinase family protein, partial [Nocardioidaceae bacterium]|nr:protein kinase family protein [Nocardioidaceae bacterium]